MTTFTYLREVLEGLFWTHTSPCWRIFCTNTLWPRDFLAYFAFLLLLAELVFTWEISSDHTIFYYYMCTYLLWPIFHRYVHLWPIFYTWNLLWPILYTYPAVLTFSISKTTSLDLVLYVSDFYGLLCLFTFPWWDYVYLFFSYLCTFLWWPILYTYLLW